MILSFKSYEIRPCIEIAGEVTSYTSITDFGAALRAAPGSCLAYWTVYGWHEIGLGNLQAQAIGDFATQNEAWWIACALANSPGADVSPSFGTSHFQKISPLAAAGGEAMTALCIFEAMLMAQMNSPEDSDPLSDMRDVWENEGVFHMRQIALDLVPAASTIWTELDKRGIEPSFDWELIPAFLEYVDWHSGASVDVPVVTEALIAKFMKQKDSPAPRPETVPQVQPETNSQEDSSHPLDRAESTLKWLAQLVEEIASGDGKSIGMGSGRITNAEVVEAKAALAAITTANAARHDAIVYVDALNKQELVPGTIDFNYLYGLITR